MTDQAKSRQEVRNRVRQHLRKALAGSMALGATVASAQDGPPMVCDPLPPPIIRCETGSLQELGQRLQPYAQWQVDGANRVLHLFVGGWRSEVKLGKPRIEGGTLLPSKPQPGGHYDYAIRPAQDAKTIIATIPVPCRGANAAIRVELDLSLSDAIQVRLLDEK